MGVQPSVLRGSTVTPSGPSWLATFIPRSTGLEGGSPWHRGDVLSHDVWQAPPLPFQLLSTVFPKGISDKRNCTTTALDQRTARAVNPQNNCQNA